MTAAHRIARALAALAALAAPGCGAGLDGFHPPRPNEVEFTLLQLGDVEDLRPRAVRDRLALVAAIKQRLLREDAATFLVMPGDVFNPSPQANVPFAGERVAGRDVIEALNAVGVDFATLGNHAADLGPAELQGRLGESTARWVSTNVADGRTGLPFEGAPRHRLIEVRNSFGKRVRIGLIGLTMREGDGRGPVDRADPIPAARAEADRLAGRYDLLLALTHLRGPDNLRLAAQVHEVDAIFGGQDGAAGTARLPRPASPPVPFFDADAGAATLWVHRCAFDTDSRRLTIRSELVPLPLPTGGPAVPAPGVAGRLQGIGPDKATGELLATWATRFEEAFLAAEGRPPDTVLATLPRGVVLNGLEAEIRRRPTNLTRLVGLAMLAALDARLDGRAGGPDVPKALRDLPRLAIFNSGMVRINDLIGAGGEPAITLYHVHRAVPYAKDPAIRGVRMSGQLIGKLLEESRKEHAGQGAFLQAFDQGGRSIPDLIDRGQFHRDQDYLVAIDDFLADGREEGFEELGETGQGRPRGIGAIPALGCVSSVRVALVNYLGRGTAGLETDPVRAHGAGAPIPAVKAVVQARTRQAVPDLFGAGDGGPFLASPEPLLGSIPAPASPEFVAELEECLDVEADDVNRLRLSALLIAARPSNRRAARELVAGFLSNDRATHSTARGLLAGALPRNPPAVVEELTRTLARADEITHSDLAELLALADLARGRALPAEK